MKKNQRKEPEPQDEENEVRLPGRELVCAETPSILVCEPIEESEEDEDDPEEDE
jgi:hypothetical protein